MSELITAAPQPLREKKIKAAFFDGDGVVLNLPTEHFHEAFARRHGLDPQAFGEFFGPSYNDILRGKGNIKEQVIRYRHLWGEHDPNELVAEWLEYNSQINQPLVDVLRQRRQTDLAARKADPRNPLVGLYLTTVQEPIRFQHIKTNLVPDLFDNFYATCELGFLKVEDEDKHPETQILLEDPPARYFTMILGGLALAPYEVAFFDDRTDNIEIARRKGINAHIYESPEQVERILAL